MALSVSLFSCQHKIVEAQFPRVAHMQGRGASEPLLGSRRPRRRLEALAAAAVAGCVLLALLASVQRLQGDRRAALLSNADFLRATGGGAAGRNFLQRLQDTWFVEDKAAQEPKLAADATELVASMMSAGFPADMKAAVDVAVNPCDDFYEFACGKWDSDNKNAIPAYKSQVAFAWDRAEKEIRETETALLEHDSGSAGLFYRSCMDLERIEAAGDAPVLPWLKYIDKISDTATLMVAVTELNKHNMDNFFSWWIDTDPRDTTRKVFTIAQGGFTLPEKTYYLEDSVVMQQHRDALRKFSSKFFQLVGYSVAEADKRAASILAFETKLAGITVDKEDARKDHGAPATWAELESLAPGWPWKAWLHHLGTCSSPPDGAAKVCQRDHAKVRAVGQEGKTALYLMNKPFFPKLNALLAETELPVLKAVLAWKLLRNSALYLSSKYIDLMVEFNADLYGVSEKNPRARKCYYSVQSSTPWPMAKLYVGVSSFPFRERVP